MLVHSSCCTFLFWIQEVALWYIDLQYPFMKFSFRFNKRQKLFSSYINYSWFWNLLSELTIFPNFHKKDQIRRQHGILIIITVGGAYESLSTTDSVTCVLNDYPPLLLFQIFKSIIIIEYKEITWCFS